MAIIYDKKERIACLTINRPEAMNALDAGTWQEIFEAIEDSAPNKQQRLLTNFFNLFLVSNIYMIESRKPLAKAGSELNWW